MILPVTVVIIVTYIVYHLIRAVVIRILLGSIPEVETDLHKSLIGSIVLVVVSIVGGG